jgi:5-formyltetrahydrofolate cyclo-ligase
LTGILEHSMTNQANDMAAEKATIRSRLLTARRAYAPGERAELSVAACARLLASLATLPDREVHVVAAYASFGTEPATGLLLDELLNRGIRVLLPILVNDNDVAWGRYTGPDSLVRGTRGPDEPAVSEGVDAVLQADVVVLPGLAVDADGVRLGRGGGSYDRVMARIASVDPHVRPWTVVVLYPDEVGIPVPAEPHDGSVDAAVTADGMTRFL